MSFHTLVQETEDIDTTAKKISHKKVMIAAIAQPVYIMASSKIMFLYIPTAR